MEIYLYTYISNEANIQHSKALCPFCSSPESRHRLHLMNSRKQCLATFCPKTIFAFFESSSKVKVQKSINFSSTVMKWCRFLRIAFKQRKTLLWGPTVVLAVISCSIWTNWSFEMPIIWAISSLIRSANRRFWTFVTLSSLVAVFVAPERATPLKLVKPIYWRSPSKEKYHRTQHASALWIHNTIFLTKTKIEWRQIKWH